MVVSWATRSVPVLDEGRRRFTLRSAAQSVELVPARQAVCRVTAQRAGNVAVFSLLGSLVTTTAPEVRSWLEPARTEQMVILDIADVTDMDRDGLATLRDVVRSVHEGGGRIAVARPWRQARLVSDLVGSAGLVFLALSISSGIAWLNGSN